MSQVTPRILSLNIAQFFFLLFLFSFLKKKKKGDSVHAYLFLTAYISYFLTL